MRTDPLLPGGVLCVCLVLAQPAAATCPDSRVVHARDIRTPGVTLCDTQILCTDNTEVSGCLEPAVSAGFSGSFWALGTGDPAPGPGDDSGLLPASEWSYDPQACPLGGMPGYELSRLPRVISGNWNEPGIDGCVDGAGAYPELTGDECLVVALCDQDGGQSYFALLSGLVDTDEWGEVFFWPWRDLGPIELAPIPAPEFSLPGSPATPGQRCAIEVTAPSVSEIAAGLYLAAGCETDLVVGYNVYRIAGKKGALPSDLTLDADWELLTPAPIPLGESATVNVVGGASGRVYLAGTLVFDSGFETDRVSPLAGPVACPEPGP